MKDDAMQELSALNRRGIRCSSALLGAALASNAVSLAHGRAIDRIEHGEI